MTITSSLVSAVSEVVIASQSVDAGSQSGDPPSQSYIASSQGSAGIRRKRAAAARTGQAPRAAAVPPHQLESSHEYHAPDQTTVLTFQAEASVRQNCCSDAELFC